MDGKEAVMNIYESSENYLEAISATQTVIIQSSETPTHLSDTKVSYSIYPNPTDNELLTESLRAEIERLLKTLPDKDQKIIAAFYGIGTPELTLEEIGTKYHLTRERVRQIKEKTIRRLRNKTTDKLLKSYLG